MKQGTLGGFLTKRPRPNLDESVGGSSQTPFTNDSIHSVSNAIPQTQCSNDSGEWKDLPKDPADRQKITSYNSNVRDDVRRAYLVQGPCQIRLTNFPIKIMSRRKRSFIGSWFDEFDWLEYSVKEDKAYCLFCYVCGDLMEQRGGRDAFASQGFNTWSKKDSYRAHVGGVGSFHNKAREKCDFLMTNRFHFEVEIFNTVVDMQLNEYRDRFSETSTQLLEYMGALSPCDTFAHFDQSKLLKLSEMYKHAFDDLERIELESQLLIFYHSCIKDDRFYSLKQISELSRVMVSTGKHLSYHLVYRLLKLALILPVATASVERCFSKMKIVKTDLRNKIGDEFLNNALICHIEPDIFVKVETEKVMVRFQKMSMRRGQF